MVLINRQTPRNTKGKGIAVTVKKRYLPPDITFVMRTQQLYIYALLTKREVKTAGCWPSSFICAFMDRDEVEVYKNAK